MSISSSLTDFKARQFYVLIKSHLSALIFISVFLLSVSSLAQNHIKCEVAEHFVKNTPGQTNYCWLFRCNGLRDVLALEPSDIQVQATLESCGWGGCTERIIQQDLEGIIYRGDNRSQRGDGNLRSILVPAGIAYNRDWQCNGPFEQVLNDVSQSSSFNPRHLPNPEIDDEISCQSIGPIQAKRFTREEQRDYGFNSDDYLCYSNVQNCSANGMPINTDIFICDTARNACSTGYAGGVLCPCPINLNECAKDAIDNHGAYIGDHEMIQADDDEPSTNSSPQRRPGRRRR